MGCDCGPNETCLIEITELPDKGIDAIVTKPRAVAESGDWKPYAVVEGMCGRRFDKGTTAKHIHESLGKILDPPRMEECKSGDRGARANPLPAE